MGFVLWDTGIFRQNFGWEMGIGNPLEDPLKTF
jgi:hypothetical protein